MDADNVGEEGGNENHQKCNGHDQSRRLAGGQASGFLEQESEGPLDRPQHENDVTNANQKNVESRKATGSIYQRDSQGEENPTDDVVANAGGKNDETDSSVQQLEFCENTTKDREGSDSDRNGNEEDEVSKIDRSRDEGVIERHGDRGSKAKGYNES